MDLVAARLQMAVSLGFHIIFASIGIAMPFFMAFSHYKWLKGGGEHFLLLTRAWSKGVAMFFAVGAVSGTALSLELGLLWPEFMKHAGPIIGMPFSWEGAAFFLEAIALGLFLYGWGRLRPWTHWFAGLSVGICGVLSGLFVICANGWMNSPSGFDWVEGRAVNIDPVAAMFNRAALMQGIHMTVAAFQATAFAVAGVHAVQLLRRPDSVIHNSALRIALAFGVVASIVQPITGDLLAKDVAIRQPVKLAAMESLFQTQTYAPGLIGGIPDSKSRTVRYGVEIPGLLSFLAKGSFGAEVEGLDKTPEDEWPPVAIVHGAFQLMVACGSALAVLALVIAAGFLRYPSLFASRRFLWCVAFAAPLGFVAIEAGWTVTEVGRQPWIIYRIFRTADALTPMPGLVVSLIVFAGLYGLLSWLLVFLMRRQVSSLNAVEAKGGSGD